MTFPSSRLLRSALAAAALSAALTPLFAQTPEGIARRGQFLGQDSASSLAKGSVQLALHNKAGLDARVAALYTPGSPTFHQWLTDKDMAAYLPTAAEVEAVKKELAAHGLTVTSVGPSNLSVHFSGPSSAVESAFHTQLSLYKLDGANVRAFTSKPTLTGGAAGLMHAVVGVTGPGAQPYLVRAKNPATGKALPMRPLSRVAASKAGATPGLTYSNSYTPSACVSGPQSYSVSNYPTPSATYTGFLLDPICAYGPQDLWAFYGLTYVYDLGYLGGGQTIVLIDAYGSPTITSDYSTYNSFYGLEGGSLQVLEPNPVTGSNTDWAQETTLDVEAAHAIAPHATVDLMVTPTNSFADLLGGLEYAVSNKLGKVISNSYGAPESEVDPGTLAAFDQENEMAAAAGISVQYSTGDSGDYSYSIGYTDVSMPADSTYATAVGGTTLVVNPADGSYFTTGWGNNAVNLQNAGVVSDPPAVYGFQGGAGGGISNVYAKPSYQSSLSGTGRHLPDVSALADPFTGFAMVYTDPNAGTGVFQIGGTSLASPLFSAMWALLDEYEGSGSSIGQAAQYMSSLSGGQALPDVQAPPPGYGLTGTVTDASGTTQYSSDDLSQPLESTNTPLPLLLSYSGGYLYSLSFATDTSLAVTQGWDAVTGWGTPDFHWVKQFDSKAQQ